MGQAYTWFNTGTDSLLGAVVLTATLQKRQRLMVARSEEISYRQY